MKTYELLKTIPENFVCDDKKRIAHNRLDHDGYRWWNTWFPGIGPNGNEEMKKEMEEVSNFMVSLFPKGIPDMERMVQEGKCERLSDDEHNLYIVGEYTDIWIRLILRRGDYNMYIKFFQKQN